jgi:cation transport ATPase
VTARRVEAAATVLVGAVAVAVLGYRLGSGEPATAALGGGLAVLVLAVPGALRLATGLPQLVGTGRAARLGVLLAGPEAFTSAQHVDTVVLAGTGTLSSGGLEVQDVRTADGVAPADVLRLAGAVAQESDRPLDRAVAAAAPRLPDVAEFDTVGDLGVRGIVAEVVDVPGADRRVLAHAVLLGSAELLAVHDIGLPAELATAMTAAARVGRTPVVVAWDGVARGVLELGPTVGPATAAAMRALGGLGLRPVLLTAEAAPAAHDVAVRAGLAPDAVVAGLVPTEAAPLVRKLRESRAGVAVIAGCGRYEAALDGADLAVRVGAPHGSPGPAPTLVCRDLPAAVDALRLARRTVAVTRANTAVALGCVAAALPAAATGLLSPQLSAAATAAGAAVLAANSLRLQRHGATDR